MFPDKNEKKKKKKAARESHQKKKKKLNGYLLTRKETCKRKGENMGIAKKGQL